MYFSNFSHIKKFKERSKINNSPKMNSSRIKGALKINKSSKLTVKKMKKVTRAGLVTALHSISYKGITKTVKFQSDGNISGNAIYVNEVKAGKLVQLGLE